MRPIKFRGKRLDNGEWAYGDLVQIEGSYIYDYDIGDNGVEQKPILSQINWNVNPETVGQYTGLHDKRGVEIYEGDIVRENTELGISNINYEVGFERGHFTLTDRKSGYDRMGIWNVNTNMEVIGNIYETKQNEK